MRRFVIPILVLAALLVSGCDFMRILAGRPTSADLARKRTEMELSRQEARRQAVLDSLQRVNDSLAVVDARLRDSLSRTRGLLLQPSRMGGLGEPGLDAKYCIIVGSFRTHSFAQRRLDKYTDAGLEAVIVPFRSGLMGVGVCPSNSLAETWKNLCEMRLEGFCPKDSFILVND